MKYIMRLIPLFAACCLFGCVEYDESTYITDDNGMIHHTKHYSKDHRGHREFAKKIPATGKKRFIFDPNIPAFAAYDEAGERVLTGSASGGKDFCEDTQDSCRTISGTFKVYAKKGLDCHSRAFPVDIEGGGAKMPYCMYFYRGFTIHAGFEVPKYNTSHGCIRVLPSAAKWLNESFIDLGTEVVVLTYDKEEKNYHPEFEEEVNLG